MGRSQKLPRQASRVWGVALSSELALEISNKVQPKFVICSELQHINEILIVDAGGPVHIGRHMKAKALSVVLLCVVLLNGVSIQADNVKISSEKVGSIQVKSLHINTRK